MTVKDASRYRSNGGTLLWVGQREITEFKPVFDYCVEHASQIALRADIEEALRYPADQVVGVILARANRAPVDESWVRELTARHQGAAIQLIGPLCSGDRHNKLALPQVYWHQWRQEIERLLCPCDLVVPIAQPATVKSVAVVAGTAAAADPLMDLATSCSAAAVWCRRAETFHARNFDVVWWDDSIATPTGEVPWQRRLDTIQRHCHRKPRHVWLTNIPRVDAVGAARRAGVDVVLSKPSRIENLLSTLDADQLRPAGLKNTIARAA